MVGHKPVNTHIEQNNKLGEASKDATVDGGSN